MAESALDKGFKALKLKIGFDKKKDIQNIKSLKTLVGENEKLMTDANQAWDVNEALQMMDEISEYNLSWLEEPIPVDRPMMNGENYMRLAQRPLLAVRMSWECRGLTACFLKAF